MSDIISIYQDYGRDTAGYFNTQPIPLKGVATTNRDKREILVQFSSYDVVGGSFLARFFTDETMGEEVFVPPATTACQIFHANAPFLIIPCPQRARWVGFYLNGDVSSYLIVYRANNVDICLLNVLLFGLANFSQNMKKLLER